MATPTTDLPSPNSLPDTLNGISNNNSSGGGRICGHRHSSRGAPLLLHLLFLHLLAYQKHHHHLHLKTSPFPESCHPAPRDSSPAPEGSTPNNTIIFAPRASTHLPCPKAPCLFRNPTSRHLMLVMCPDSPPNGFKKISAMATQASPADDDDESSSRISKKNCCRLQLDGTRILNGGFMNRGKWVECNVILC